MARCRPKNSLTEERLSGWLAAPATADLFRGDSGRGTPAFEYEQAWLYDAVTMCCTEQY